MCVDVVADCALVCPVGLLVSSQVREEERLALHLLDGGDQGDKGRCLGWVEVVRSCKMGAGSVGTGQVGSVKVARSCSGQVLGLVMRCWWLRWWA